MAERTAESIERQRILNAKYRASWTPEQRKHHAEVKYATVRRKRAAARGCTVEELVNLVRVPYDQRLPTEARQNARRKAVASVEPKLPLDVVLMRLGADWARSRIAALPRLDTDGEHHLVRASISLPTYFESAHGHPLEPLVRIPGKGTCVTSPKLAWFAKYGELPSTNVSNSCGVSHCITHLKLGAWSLTPEVVLELRETYWSGGLTQTALAKMYGISQPTAAYTVLRKIWREVPPGPIELRRKAVPNEGRGNWRMVPPLEEALEVSPCLPEEEADDSLPATTGRPQRLQDGLWTTFESLRRAEVVSGLERLVLARLLREGIEWRMEPLEVGQHHAESPLSTSWMVDHAGQGWLGDGFRVTSGVWQ